MEIQSDKRSPCSPQYIGFAIRHFDIRLSMHTNVIARSRRDAPKKQRVVSCRVIQAYSRV